MSATNRQLTRSTLVLSALSDDGPLTEQRLVEIFMGKEIDPFSSIELHVVLERHESLTPEQMHQACLEQGTDPEFFANN